MAYSIQQAMPVAEEGLEKMAPTVAKVGATLTKEMAPVYKEVAKDIAPVYGEVAKEISKGIKEGLQDSDNNQTKE